MTCDTEERGAPVVDVPAKRVYDAAEIEVDWHDFLARLRRPGSAVIVDEVVRPIRAEATGLQYRCTGAGVTAARENARFPWPKIAAQTIVDGSVTWTAEPVSAASLRTVIVTEEWPAVAGLTYTGAVSQDQRYQITVGGGIAGQVYEVIHRVTLANGSRKEAVARLPVRD